MLRLTQQEGTAAQLRGLLALCNTAVVDVKPKHWEVQRRLSWFISSLFMDVPRPAPVARAFSERRASVTALWIDSLRSGYTSAVRSPGASSARRGPDPQSMIAVAVVLYVCDARARTTISG